DSCLFCLSAGGDLRQSFPLLRSADFTIAPDLVPSVRRLDPPVRFITATGVGEDGESFALATDAVAQFLLGCYERDQTPEWTRYWGMTLGDWRAEVQRLRHE